MIGKASGEPKIQMAEAMDSAIGLMASNPSAQAPKTPFNPHPSVQQSGQTPRTVFCAKSIVVSSPLCGILNEESKIEEHTTRESNAGRKNERNEGNEFISKSSLVIPASDTTNRYDRSVMRPYDK